jgi:hopanoid biosynthesis associated RND transporter like protein HpnN
VAELGLIAGTGMFISLFCNMTVLPALLCLGATGIRPDHRAWLDFFDRGLAKFAARHARAIRLAAVGTGVACALALPYVRFDHDAVGLRDPGSESVQTMHDLLADKRQSPWNIDVLAPDLASAKRIADRLEKLDVVDHTVTALDFVPADQEEKLEILADLALFLPMETHFDPAFPRPSQQDQLELLASFRDVLRDGWGTREDQPELAAAARELAATLDRVLTEAQREGQAEPLLERLEVQLVGPLPDHLRRFWQALTPDEEGVVLSDLPSDLTSRLLAADGRARVQVLPSEDLTERPAMDRFVAGVRQLYPDATGMAVSLLETAHAIVRSLQQALAAAALVIAVLLFVMWRKVRDTLLVMAPLTLASAMICATSVLIGLSFNFANVVVLPLLLGIGVDSGIHLVHRHRISDVEGHEVLETSTARAILFSGLTTVGSFGTLAFSSHHGLASLGQLLTLGVIYMLICNLIVLPAMLVGRRQREDAARAAEVVSTAQLGS